MGYLAHSEIVLENLYEVPDSEVWGDILQLPHATNTSCSEDK